MQEIELKEIKKDYRSNEAYKSLRTNIEFSGEDNKVLVFTSCTPNEGKSTVTIALAQSPLFPFPTVGLMPTLVTAT